MRKVNVILRIIKRILVRLKLIWNERNFGAIGKRCFIIKPLQIDGGKSIYIDDDVCIAQSAWLMGNSQKTKTLHIMSGTAIGHHAHIIALNDVTIEEDVLIADKVFITDCTHEYEDVSKPIKNQPIKVLASVKIGASSWIGENVCILGVSVGKHCVIGANSVVTSDIPDYSVAVGSPAKIIKKYDFEINEWIKI